MIQSLLSSSGQQAAAQRAVQLQGYVNNAAVNPASINAPSSQNSTIQPFGEVLKSTAQSQFGSLLTNQATTNVDAQIALPQLPAFTQSAAVSPTNTYAKASKPQLLNMISQIAHKHGVDEKLVKALIKQESGFNPSATSHCGAKGLMQLMPSTAKTLGVNDPYNPVQNVDGGVRHLKWLLSKYHGNVVLALAAYNAGSGAVDKYDGIPPYAETQNYVKSILKNYLS